jgi:hypothetical protein
MTGRYKTMKNNKVLAFKIKDTKEDYDTKALINDLKHQHNNNTNRGSAAIIAEYKKFIGEE